MTPVCSRAAGLLSLSLQVVVSRLGRPDVSEAIGSLGGEHGPALAYHLISPVRPTSFPATRPTVLPVLQNATAAIPWAKTANKGGVSNV